VKGRQLVLARYVVVGREEGVRKEGGTEGQRAKGEGRGHDKEAMRKEQKRCGW